MPKCICVLKFWLFEGIKIHTGNLKKKLFKHPKLFINIQTEVNKRCLFGLATTLYNVCLSVRGEKQRMHLRDGFLADQLDPIYVAYNM